MTNPPTDREHTTGGATDTEQSVTVSSLFAETRDQIEANPSVVIAFVGAGIILASIDWLLQQGPIPTVGFEGIQSGRITVSFGILLSVASRATIPPSSLIGLKPVWLGAALGAELLSVVVVAVAGAYALARLLDVPPTVSAALRYTGLMVLMRFGIGRLNFEGGAVIFAIPLLVAALFVLVRLVPFPGLVIEGYPVWAALERSWGLARGHGRSLFGVVLVVGFANHLLASIPLVGPVGSALAGVVHAGVVAAFLHQVEL